MSVGVRLEEERKRLKYTQAEVACRIGVSQSKITKAENGNYTLKYEELRRLSELSFDIHYIITGVKHVLSSESRMMKKDYNYILAALRVLISAYLFYRESGKIRMDLMVGNDYAKYILETFGTDETVFRYIERTKRKSKEQMRQEFLVDTKKYRALSNGNALPDGEILTAVYERFHIPPAVILKDRNGLAREFDYLLEQLSDGERRGVLYFINMQLSGLPVNPRGEV